MRTAFIVTALCSFILAAPVFAAGEEYEEVIYLKNGSVIHGTIIEQVPGVSYKIETKSGDIFAFKAGEVEKIAKEPVTPARAAAGAEGWGRNIVAISGNAGGIFIDGNFGSVGVECAFQAGDYFALGPEFTYAFRSNDTAIIAGLEFRPYFVPYSRSVFVKPHVYFGGGYISETVTEWIFKATADGGYARAGGGVDFRIPYNFVVPYFDVGAFTTFSGGESKTKAQAEGGVRFAF